MKQYILFLGLLAYFLTSCMEPTKVPQQQDQIAVSMVLNANPMDTLPYLIKNIRGDWYQYDEWNTGIDISYIVNRVIDKDDSIYVDGDSLNTMIPAFITIAGNQEEYSFNSGKIRFDSIIVVFHEVFYQTFYYQFMPYIRDENLKIQPGMKYSVTVETTDGSKYTGYTRVPGEFHFLPWEDGHYLKKAGNNKWKIRWTKSSNGFEYYLYLYGFHDDYQAYYHTYHIDISNTCESIFEFHSYNPSQIPEIPGVDVPYPNKFFGQVYVIDENIYRYRYLLQDPAGWTNCLGVLGSTNSTAIIFEQNLE